MTCHYPNGMVGGMLLQQILEIQFVRFWTRLILAVDRVQYILYLLSHHLRISTE
jgi:hypothetical protein